MKGIEFHTILAIIIIIAVIAIVILVVVKPSLIFVSATGEQITFSEFCYYWSISGYSEEYGQTVKRNNIIRGCPAGCDTYINYCPPETVIGNNVDACRRLCEGAV